LIASNDFSALEIEQCIHSGFTVPQDATEFPSSSVSSTENFSEWNGVTGKLGADGLAQELAFMEDAHLRHVPRVNPEVTGSPRYAASVVEM
jgi:hypothetical protein